MLFAGLLVGHDALRCGNDSNAQSLEDAGQLVSAGVYAKAGFADAAKALNGFLLAGEILEYRRR